jgi:hypothetical protein
MRKIAVLEEDNVSGIMENAKSVSGFRLQFLDENGKQIIHKVDVRSINVQDLLRHLRRGESVLITPKLQEDFSPQAKKLERESWYFTRT